MFFDEIDALAPSREESHEATKKVVATMLQNMDGMRANPNVTIVAASNRPQDIDPALKRPGRIDKFSINKCTTYPSLIKHREIPIIEWTNNIIINRFTG